MYFIFTYFRDQFNSSSAAAEKAPSRVMKAEELLELLHSKDHVGAITCQEGDVSRSPFIDEYLTKEVRFLEE